MDLIFSRITFEDISIHDLYRILQLRQEIFIVEQNCPYLDIDDKDQEAYHIIGRVNGQIVAYTRILPKGISYDDYASIGRVVTLKSSRGMGYGIKLMKHTISEIQSLFPGTNIRISAQVYLDKFYSSLGFKKVGGNYLEDNIPHQAMILKFDD